jgi:redox-sensitive bicupin YhaK (pirin superfamily)
VIRILRSGERFRSEQPGIVSWHCFSAGAHYDPGNVSFGPIVGVDEHRVEAGAGFDWHAHRGVRILSFVLTGVLRHQDDAGRDRRIRAGELVEQDAAGGIRHRETNGSPEPLRFVQTTLLAAELNPRLDVRREPAPTPSGPWHLFVAAGSWQLSADELGPGDSVRGAGPAPVTGSGLLLVLSW